MSSPIITVRGLSVGFGNEALLERLDFDVVRGDVFAILGGSGTGKSTLMRHLVGLDRPMAGEVLVDGVRPTLEGRPRVGLLFQSGALFGSLDLLENVTLPLRQWTRLSKSAVERVAAAKLRLVGLEGFEHHLPAEISGGMKKRAGIARALALDPPLVYLDEPSAGLDPVTSAHMDDLILSLNQNLGVTIVVVTHELGSIARVAKNCILLHRDRRGIIASGDPRVLAAQSSDVRVREFFRSAEATVVNP